MSQQINKAKSDISHEQKFSHGQMLEKRMVAVAKLQVFLLITLFEANDISSDGVHPNDNWLQKNSIKWKTKVTLLLQLKKKLTYDKNATLSANDNQAFFVFF